MAEQRFPVISEFEKTEFGQPPDLSLKAASSIALRDI
jgi:hypothetical protein